MSVKCSRAMCDVVEARCRDCNTRWNALPHNRVGMLYLVVIECTEVGTCGDRVKAISFCMRSASLQIIRVKVRAPLGVETMAPFMIIDDFEISVFGRHLRQDIKS